jgi:hypothetical protein
MKTRATSRALVLATAGGLVTASLMGAASAKGQPTHLKRTHLTIKSATTRQSPTSNKYKATITGTLRSHHTGVANEPVTVNMRSNSSKKWTPAPQTGTTDQNGKVVITLTQSNTREQYQLVFAGDTANNYKGSHSGTITVNALRSTTTDAPTSDAPTS